jgi:hypothetical protein
MSEVPLYLQRAAAVHVHQVAPEVPHPVRPQHAVQRIWHMPDSEGQILALAKARFWPWLPGKGEVARGEKMLQSGTTVTEYSLL